jgi:hypothetical protein
MLERTKKLPTDEIVTLRLRVHRSNADRVKRYVAALEQEKEGTPRPWRKVLTELRPDDQIPSAVLRGSRVKEEITQEELSVMTGIPRRHISEMEHGKRPIGKESARKLATALKCEYRVFL